MDILEFALFAALCAVIFWGVTQHMTNKTIKQMRERAKQAVAEMRF